MQPLCQHGFLSTKFREDEEMEFLYHQFLVNLVEK